MPQNIVIQVGQCGNQIGARFWDKVLQEHAHYNKLQPTYNAPFGTFFRTNSKSSSTLNNNNDDLKDLKARCVMVDMEEGVINQVQKSLIGDLFDNIIQSTDGSGNNWSVGYKKYGPEFENQLLESIRKEAEMCDALQSFFLMYSLGGGTGSGLGSFITDLLAEHYPDIYKFASVIFPSSNDDVVTSPYNSVLSASKLIQNVDCVLPIENKALLDIYDTIQSQSNKKSLPHKIATNLSSNGDRVFTNRKNLSSKPKAFDTMNNIVANLLMNMTSSMRFEGAMNVDINDITTNLVPFPRLKFLSSSMTPLYTLMDVGATPRTLDQMFTDAFDTKTQLVKCDPKSGTFLACGLVFRGNIDISDLRYNIDRIRTSLKFAKWNQESWKTGICAFPPVGQKSCLLTLSNNTCLADSLNEMKQRFNRLYRRKANLHHYTRYIDQEYFESSIHDLTEVVQEYKSHIA